MVFVFPLNLLCSLVVKSRGERLMILLFGKIQDKWKTLVHTARISPQQRRGEPVPQDLLDRVLAAHSYWSQQQAKQQLKQPSDACLLL